MIMKQLLFIILAICVILMIGCQSEDSTETDPLYLDATWQDANNTHQTETTGTTRATEGSDITEATTQPVRPETTQPPTEGMTKTDNDGSEPTEPKPKPTTPPPTEATKPKVEETQPATEATVPTTPPTEATKPSATAATEPPATKPTEPEEPKATAADIWVIVSKMVDYLNAYRTEQGSCTVTVLPGLTQYAEYRSRQLVSNFAHDTFDERAAATALEYGSYIDPSLYGMTGDPYYTADAREAIAKTDFGGSADALAARLARMVRTSSSHWSYVGSAEYTYIGVGITYTNGVWYCDIAVTGKNTDG